MKPSERRREARRCWLANLTSAMLASKLSVQTPRCCQELSTMMPEIARQLRDLFEWRFS